MRRYAAVLLDLDGTLVDSNDAHAHAWVEALAKHGVEVTFERGPARRFDLIVGADGLHSNVRRLVFGPESRHTTWIGAYLAYPRGLWVPGLLVDIAALVSGGYRRFLIG